MPLRVPLGTPRGLSLAALLLRADWMRAYKAPQKTLRPPHLRALKQRCCDRQSTATSLVVNASPDEPLAAAASEQDPEITSLSELEALSTPLQPRPLFRRFVQWGDRIRTMQGNGCARSMTPQSSFVG